MSTRILVVDDEETLRTVITDVLADDGHEVVSAASAEQALQMFRAEPYPLIITDIVMGKMSGLELLEAVKKLDEDALVVVMTSQASLETATAALRSGAYDFLVKPFEDIDLISAVVNRAVDRIRLIQDNRKLMARLKAYAENLEQLNEQLRTMVNRDGLTGLHNHRSLREALTVELSRSERHGRVFSIVFMDIDHFKTYNDTHGHLAGDEALKSVGQLLERHSRKSTIAARYGGEEFVLLLPETDKEGARACAEHIRKVIEAHPFEGQESQPLGNVTLSLGVASFPTDGETAGDLIDHADKALYQAKHSGRNQVVSWEPVGA